MTTSAINSGAINQTPFPGAESGLSLIELIGTVQVVCTIPSFTLRRSAGAATDPKANGTAATVKKSLLGAAIVCNATPNATAISKVPVIPIVLAQCTVAATSRLSYRQSATATATATIAASGGYLAVKRAVYIESVAAPASIAAKTQVYRGASTSAVAWSSASTLRKLAAYIEQVAIASNTATAKLKTRLGAQTAGSATGSSSTRVRITMSGTTVAIATGTAPAYIKEPTGAFTPCVATCLPISPIRGMSFGATTQANALVNATIRLRYGMSASVTATAIAQSTAADYATAMPAPAERKMTVQGYDRRMEVTE